MSNIDEYCIICSELLISNTNVTFANCIHGNCFHAKCIIRWNDKCPVCRAIIYDQNHTIHSVQRKINYNFKTSNFI